MKRTETLIGKYGNAATHSEYLVVEIECTSSTPDSQCGKKFSVQRHYQTFNGEALEPLGGVKPERFRVPSTNEIIEKMSLSH
ncbi:hypothetical protein FJM67_15930 [Maribrevibacterium harenarium]|uniref:Uncharacterized protein n=1 Tax=Maribrevibacterium harenarium TaxID=2589817 RepID=A0A501WER5_9GAMM|nr:hypothetical protein [Maribrevibacterium harenarium]TPE46564.1 hypothetical protein FJM67_15930 [Maribrevibacterium harenarium]